MNILTICGSPRRKGNTATVLSAFEKKAGINHFVEHVDIITRNIKGCIGCDACQKDISSPACIQQDDMDALLQKIIASDLVVYAAPVYVWDFPAQMKAAIDRHYALLKWKGENEISLIRNKKTMLLATCGGDAENNADLIRLIFEREMRYLQCQIVGEFILPNCTIPSELGARKDDVANQMMEAVSSVNKSDSH